MYKIKQFSGSRHHIIFVLSVQHTGTWFMIRFLQQYVPRLLELHKPWDTLVADENIIVHAHMPDTGIVKHDSERCRSFNCLQLLTSTFGAIVPMRDPLLSLITRQSLHPKLSHEYIVDGFVFLATQLATTERAYFVPVDLNKDYPDRVAMMQGVLDFAGIEGNADCQYVREWKPVSWVKDSDLHKAYRANDITYLRSHIKTVEYLQIHAAIIKPFLERLGYDHFIW